MTPALTDRRAWHYFMLAACLGVGVYLAYRLLGVYPHIFADEWYYSKMSRLQPLKDSILPSWLYLWLFGGSNACGTHFYDCVHAGNILFYAGATPFIYLTARALTGKTLAMLLALLSMLAPLNIYTAYFMPESMYYFGFCVLSWIALARTGWHWALHAAATGAVLGLMSLVKVHALFLLPALCLFLVYARWAGGGRWLARAAGSLAMAVACFFLVKFGIGYLLAGDAALNLFGNFYQGAANAASGRSILSLMPASFVNARGHMMALAMLLPLPLAIIATSVLRPPSRQQAGPRELLQLYALLMLGAAVGMTVVYTASIANPGVTEEGLRLHQRYYSFAFPLLWLVAATSIGQAAAQGRAALRWIIALLLLAVLGLAIVKLPSYALNPVDGPDVFSVTPAGWHGRFVLVLDAAVLLLWAAGHRHAGSLFVYAALPVTLAFGLHTSNEQIAATRVPTPAEHAGEYARAHIPPGEHKRITVAGTDEQQMIHLQFEIDDPDTSLLVLPADAPIEQYQLPLRGGWLFVLGKHALPGKVHPQVQNDGFALLHVNSTQRTIGQASLSAPFGHGLIAGAEGLSKAEQFGRWSDAGKVVIHFNAPLPRHLRVILRAQAFDMNAELPFTMHVGDQSAHFRLGWVPSDVGLEFETDGAQRELVIDVPHPVSPLERGQPDARKLGIGIGEIEIGDTGGGEQANN
jgi:phosphoglycerol transferase